MRAARELGDELPVLHAPRRALVREPRGGGRRRSATRSQAEDWDLAVDARRRALVRPLRARPGRRAPRARRRAPRRPAGARRRARRGAGLHGARRRRHRRPRERHLEHAECAEGALPETRRRALPRDDGARAAVPRAPGGRLRRRAERGRRAARRGGEPRRLVRRRPPGARPRQARARRRCGPTASTARGPSCSEAIALARAIGLDYVAVAALRQLSLLEQIDVGPERSVAIAREAVELAERRGWIAIPQTAGAHAALARPPCSPTCVPTTPSEHLDRARDALANADLRQPAFLVALVAARIHARQRPARGRPARARALRGDAPGRGQRAVRARDDRLHARPRARGHGRPRRQRGSGSRRSSASRGRSWR